MDARRWVVCTLGLLLLCSGFLLASQPHSEKALWIEVKEKGNQQTTIAMTEGIARQLLESDETKVNFSEKGKRDLITREMLTAVLEGRQESAEVRDPEDGSEAKIYMKDLDVPGKGDGKNRLVLATYKSGRETFRIALPEIEMESHDERSNDFVKINFGWKGLLPFLAKEGGAVYIEDGKDDTEVWIYVE